MDLPTAAPRGQPRRMRRTQAALLLLAIGLAVPARPLRAANPPEIWLAPHAGHPTVPGAADYGTLFYASNPAWVALASKVQVYSLNVSHLSIATDAELLRMGGDLRARHIALNITFGGVARQPGDTCAIGEGYETPASVQAFAARLQRLQIRPDIISMDSPLWFGHYDKRYCKFPVATLIQRVAANLAVWTSLFPGLSYGDIEPWVEIEDDPNWQPEYAALKDGIAVATGVRLSFAHTDTNIYAHPNWASALVAAQAFVHEQGMKYGMIYDGLDTETSSAQWVADAKARIATMESQMHVIPDTAIIASWYKFPTDVLPPTDPTTLSGLLFYYVALPH
jgi:hypothetical protein